MELNFFILTSSSQGLSLPSKMHRSPPGYLGSLCTSSSSSPMAYLSLVGILIFTRVSPTQSGISLRRLCAKKTTGVFRQYLHLSPLSSSPTALGVGSLILIGQSSSSCDGYLRQLDKLELKAVNDGSASYAALERKAELYEKLCRGELPDEEEKEKYCVDFFTKGIVQEEAGPHEVPESPGVPPVSEDDDTDSVSLATKLIGPGRTSVTMNKDEHKRFVREVHEQASEAREKASLLKLRRQEQEAARREKLKQAYLRKQLEKLKAGKIEPS